ncbi:predicted protein [Chaetomium globosum CBS 148.51]|uniref:Stc1 domain-containing protein n=1 Tax=Chaetomium globosum (strain ATCC 6205 / CBS 148.51 / DSM 1962 / NBRC 6347 / NRRL 1970) TaxID=306901 RepID=Q2HAE9_CHAGB|nr:uncharacterized protein CHGG_02805 [Chaetomium globosum CBS 148.51]EAQ90870.1 predicted protein [Chaetomium globosum CBS 148.51]
MHFSVTKEVGWEADDEREGPKSKLGVKKRYRIILDFSRRSSRRRTKAAHRKGPPPESDLDDDDAADRYEDGSPRPLQHYCYNCEAPRSIHYHQDYPLQRGKTTSPRLSLCAECRARRNARLAAAEDAEDSQADDDNDDGGKPRPHQPHHHHHHHEYRDAAAAPADLEPRGDDREWCAKCGTLRSNRFHDKVLLSGGAARLPPWKEVCGRCVVGMVRRKERARALRRRRGEYREGEGEGDGDGDGERYDPLRESLWGDCRSRPYVFGPGEVGGREGDGGAPVAGVTAASGVRGGFERAGDTERGGSLLAATGACEDASRSSLGMSKATVENATPEDGRVGVRGGCQVRQGAGENRQSQQPGQPTYGQQKGTQTREEPRLATANSTLGGAEAPQEGRELRDCFRPPHLEKHFKEKVRPKPRPQEPRDKPMPAPAPSAASSSQQYREPHEMREYFKFPNPMQPLQPGEKPATAAETKDYFRLPNPVKPLEPGKKPATTTEPKQRRDAGNPRYERNPTRHGHRKRASVSSTKSPMPAVAEPVYFKGHFPAKAQAQQSEPKSQPKPTHPTNPFFNRRKPEPKPEPKPDVHFNQQSQQQQQKQRHHEQAREQERPQRQQRQQQEQQAPPPRPMGISDMYWSSAYGQAEKTYAAAAFFFPGAASAHDGGATEDGADRYRSAATGSNNSSHNGDNGNSARHRRHSHRHRPAEDTVEHATEHAAAGAEMPDFGHVFRASMGHRAGAAKAEANAADFDGDDNQIWEVDSDEAEEIEEVHARMFC